MNIMKNKFILILAGLTILFPALSRADNATAQDYDDSGQALYRQGLYEKAVPYFQNAIQADPADWQAYENLGDAYAKLNNNASALTAYQMSLQIHPDNPVLKTQIDLLKASASSPVTPPPSGGEAAPPPAENENKEQSNFDQFVSEHPFLTNKYVPGTPTPLPAPKPVVKVRQDLNPIDYSKLWTQFQLGYNYSLQSDLVNGAAAYNSLIKTEGGAGSVQASNSGLNLGFEIGFLIDPTDGLALGIHFLSTNDYTAKVNFQNGISGTPPDFQNETLSPYVIPFTLDYYYFIPDRDGRFFITGGVGYYAATLHVQNNYSYQIQTNDPNNADYESGDLSSGGIGFQLGLGREWAIDKSFGFSLIARGRYARINNFRGVLTDTNGNSGNFELAKYSDSTIDVAPAGQNGASDGTLDFTGFDLIAALTFYSY